MRKILFIAVYLFFYCLAFGQDETSAKGFQKSKLFTGGSVGLTFGNYTIINLSPQVGYHFNDHFAAGVGLSLLYASHKVKQNGLDYSKTVQGMTGLNLFGRFYPFQNFFLQVQPEVDYIFGNINYYQPPAPGKYKLDAEIVPSFLVGGGVAIPTGKGVIVTTVLYEVLQKTNSPYSTQPMLAVGYNFQF